MKIKFEIIKEEAHLVKFLKDFSTSGLPTFDTETTSLNFNSQLLGITLYDGVKPPAFVYSNTPYLSGIPKNRLIELLNPIFLKGEWGAHNGLYDIWVLKCKGFNPPKLSDDSMIAIHLWDCELMKNLETRVKEDFKYSKPKFTEVIGKNWNRIDWIKDTQSGLINHNNLAEYAAEDGFWTYQLIKKYVDKVVSPTITYKHKGQTQEDSSRLLSLYKNIEMPLIEVLADMKYQGVKIDLKLLETLRFHVEQDIEALREEIYEEAGAIFNINSSQQKAKILYENLKLPVLSYTKGGSPATDSSTLEELANSGAPIAKLLTKYSEINKIYTGYILSIPNLVDSDGRLRCNFNSSGTKTGRFSSSDPNLQNQPNNDEYPIRKAFIAEEGNLLSIGDFSQIEPRLMSHLSQDEKLIKIYHEGGDIYQGIADDLKITRKQAKVVVLAISYGMGPAKLANSLGISEKEANQIIYKDFYGTYKTFANWKSWVEKEAEKKGYVTTMFGRIRRLPGIKSSNKSEFFGALRQAVNTVVQGSAADFCKLAMVKLHERFVKELDGRAHILLQVHDELVSEAPRADILKTKFLMEDVMENLLKFRVPIKFECKICNNWAEMKDDSFTGVEVIAPSNKIELFNPFIYKI